jgi:arylsulfatase A-like enzyme
MSEGWEWPRSRVKPSPVNWPSLTIDPSGWRPVGSAAVRSVASLLVLAAAVAVPRHLSWAAPLDRRPDILGDPGLRGVPVRRPGTRRARWAALLLMAGVFIQPAGGPARGQESRPNILVILTDDQRATGTVTPLAMPTTRRRIRDGGTRFSNAFATTPLCCPSRASIFTGQYAHNHGVRTNGDAGALDHGDTVQRYLRDAGYLTGLVGKFLNGWPLHRRPPHFDRYTLVQPGYRDVQANKDGQTVHVNRYVTDYVAMRARNTILDFEDQDATPWMLFVHPYAPHQPFVIEKRYQDAPVGRWDLNPAVREHDLSDKPPYVRHREPSPRRARSYRRYQLRMLMSVDDLVAKTFNALVDTGELQDTLVIFLSDNGFMWGEHTLFGKTHAYIQSAEIPLYVRWPGHVPAGTVDPRLAANIDVAPTILEAAGVEAQHVLDGRSLLGTVPRDHLLLESFFHHPQKDIPKWASNLSQKIQYTEYYADNETSRIFREYYERGPDPWQLRNRLGPGQQPPPPGSVAVVEAQLGRDRSCQGTSGPGGVSVTASQEYRRMLGGQRRALQGARAAVANSAKRLKGAIDPPNDAL